MGEKIFSISVNATTIPVHFLDKVSMLTHLIRGLARQVLKNAVLAAGMVAAFTASAADVEIRISNKVSATADFRPGESEKPAILILHGFLQTREFSTIKSLRDSLADSGYTVLSPNLSLGITYRKRSLGCEALHLHDMADDVKEIDLWVKWLKARGYRKIIGLGHSFGATQLLSWAEQHPDRNFKIIGISLVGTRPFTNVRLPDAKTLKKPGNELLHVPLSFCETYTAPVNKYISYYKWNEERILAALKPAKGRVDTIIGSEDKYLPSRWGDQLAKAGARIHLIKGGNHFMDGTHEFDMVDSVLNILRTEHK